MADAKQDRNKQQKDASSEGTGFKTVMGGFDKNEVNLYINKLKRQMKDQQEELERRIQNLQTNLEEAHKESTEAKNAKKAAEEAAASFSSASPIIKDNSAETKKMIDAIKAESEKKIMELRKSVLDERRNVAKFDKECAMAKMSEKKIREEYEKLKAKYLDLKKRGGGSSNAVTTSNAEEVLDEAGAYAKEIIAAAKSYADETVKAANKYKADVEAELSARSETLNDIKRKLDEQIRRTTKEQANSAARTKEITDKIGAVTVLFDNFAAQFNSVNSQIGDVTGKIDTICRQFSESSDQITSAAKAISETTDLISETKSDIDNIAKLVDSTKLGVMGAKSEVEGAHNAAGFQADAADLSPIAKISEEIAAASGDLQAKLELPSFDESKFSDARFDEIKKKFKMETTYENADGSAADDDDEFEDSDIITSIQIDSPAISSTVDDDDDLMSSMPDLSPAASASAPDVRTAPTAAPMRDKAERPGLDANFEDFFTKPPKDDDLSGEMPLINMEGVGAIDDFSLDSAPEPIGGNFDITPNDLTKKAEKGADLGEDIFDIAINPLSTDDDTLANMMADASAAEKAANRDFSPVDFNFDADEAKPTGGADDFGEFADLFAQGSTQTDISAAKKHEKPDFRKPPSDDPWSFGNDNSDDSDLSSDTDLSDLLI